MKYTIKNCPAYCDNTRLCRGAYNRTIEYQYCSGNGEENCLLKWIVELCKRYQQRCQVCPTHDVCFECESVSGKQLSDEILNLLEIEEVE